MANLGPYEIIALLVPIIVVGVIARSAGRRGRRWDPDAWAASMGVTLTSGNQALVQSYLVRTRRLRLLGAVGGFIAPHVYAAVLGHAPPQVFSWDLVDALVGYLLAALVAELTTARPRADVRTAVLRPRRLGDYLAPRFTVTLRATSVAALALVGLAGVSPLPVHADLLPTPVAVTAILVVVVGVEWAQRHVVGRAQTVVGDDITRADDAIRSASVHALAAAGVALQLLVASVHAAVIALWVGHDVVAISLALTGVVLALGSWSYIARPQRAPHRLRDGITA